ncbi:MAG: RNA polymerase subunit sigma-24 [Planctomycetes bacterium]|nr:RNA polymerase subunit sigma-24 [Planctomycetota bacterium]
MASAHDVPAAIEAIYRIESPRIVAGLTRIVGDVGVAEDLAQDALLAALEQWPASGIPENPGAWLMAAARHRAVDRVRHERMRARKHEEIGRARAADGADPTDAMDAALDDPIGDDLLRLVFLTCHPVLSLEARIALTLRLLGGLTTEEIARGFLTGEPTVAQRIVRAKRTLAEQRVPFEVPRGAALGERLAGVLAVLYLIFNEGYTATAGAEWTRPPLCLEALRLGRVLAGLLPGEPEVHGLVALMEFQASRLRARRGPSGAILRLAEQDRTLWDQTLVRRGVAALQRARDLGGPPGKHLLEAEIAACHALARSVETTEWARIVQLYDRLLEVAPSPVVALNRVVAVSMASGPEQALVLLDTLAGVPQLRGYHLLPAVRGDFLFRLGRRAEARAEFERAAALTRNDRERELLLARSQACTEPGSS